MPAGTANWRRAVGPGGHQRNPEWRLDEPANRADNPAPYASSAGVVTTLSPLGANRGSRPETARDGLCWSENFETHCKTTKFNRCLTGGQVVAGSNPVSPTDENGVYLRLRCVGKPKSLEGADHLGTTDAV